MCDHHLRDYFGLEIGYSYIETPTETVYVGFNLKPVPGVFFRPNDVILPVREIIDKTYRPKQVVSLASDRVYRINTRLNEVVQRMFNGGRITTGDRYTFEMIRNLSEIPSSVNVNPIEHCEVNPQPLAFIKSKLYIAETFIQQNSNMARINDTTVYMPTEDPSQDNKFEAAEKELKALNLSLSYRYMLSKMEFSTHVTYSMKDSQTKEITANLESQRMKPNAMLVPDIGLVAISDISDPDYIIVAGCTRNVTYDNLNGYYDEICIVYPKEIVHSKPAAHRLTTQNANRRAMMSSCI